MQNHQINILMVKKRLRVRVGGYNSNPDNQIESDSSFIKCFPEKVHLCVICDFVWRSEDGFYYVM